MTAAPAPEVRRPRRSAAARIWMVAAVPVTVVVLAVLLGAAIVLVSELLVPGKAFDWGLPLVAYGALVEGAFGSSDAVVSTLVNSTPLVFGGLAVGFGFKAGLFNIGAQGQFLVGALGAVIVGVWMADAPAIVAIPAAALAGFVAGGLWGFVPGFLKAVSGRPRSGQHDHDELHRGPAPGRARERAAEGAAVALPGDLRRRQRGVPDPARAQRPPRDRAGAAGRRLRLVAPVPDHLGLRGPLGRRQPRRVALCRACGRS